MTDITDYMMRQATEADEKADEMMAKAEEQRFTIEVHLSGLTGDAIRAQIQQVEERAHFHRGQASGWRQATFVVLQHLGTPAHD